VWKKYKTTTSLVYIVSWINKCWIHGLIHEKYCACCTFDQKDVQIRFVVLTTPSMRSYFRALFLHIPVYQNMLSIFRRDSCIQICEFGLDWPCPWLSLSAEIVLVSNNPIDFHVTSWLANFSDWTLAQDPNTNA